MNSGRHMANVVNFCAASSRSLVIMAQSSTLNHYQLKTRGRYHKVTQDQQGKTDERTTFFILAVVLAPVSAIAIVGVYGFAVWISQLIMGPPGSVF